MIHLRTLALTIAVSATAYGRGETHVWTTSFQESQLGCAIAVIGDVTADGIDDFVVGANDALVQCRAGRVFVVNGASGATIRTLDGVDAAYGFGSRVAAAGDVNGDAIPDFLTSAPQPFSYSAPGKVRIHSGLDGAVLREFESYDFNFAIDIAGGHDIDGDSIPDVVIATSESQYSKSHPSRVEVFSGASGTLLYALSSPIPSAHHLELEFVGDLNGDNVSDLALGSYDASTNGTSSGHVVVISAVTGAILFNIPGLDSFDWFGYSISELGDVNSDGKPDFAVGAANDELGLGNAGSASVISGATGNRIWTVAGTKAGQRMGYSMARIADLNANGVPEVVCGSFGWPSQGFGAVDVLDGSNGALLYNFAGTFSAWAGMAIEGIPDTDGDGKDEILNGAQWANSSHAGRLSRIAPVATGLPTVLDIEGKIAHYGTSLPDSFGNKAHFVASGSTTPGGVLNLSVQDAIGGQSCAFLIGTTDLCQLISPVGALLFTSPIVIVVAPLAGVGPGNGTLSLNATIPTTPLPFYIHIQALCSDPNTPLGFTQGRAVRLKFF